MREMEIDMSNPREPVLWVKGKSIKRYSWAKVTAKDLISNAGFYGMSKKEKAVSFYRQYGVPASVCAKFLNDGLIKMSLGAVKGHEELCYSHGKFCPTRTIAVCEMKDELDQALSDGNKNITPFIARLRRNPQELKLLLGSAMWKQVCKNTFTRNKGLAEVLYEDDGSIKELIKEIIFVPSGILKYKSLARNVLQYNYMNKKCGFTVKEIQRNWKSDEQIYKTSRIISDTRRMAEQLEENFSYEWSWRKMQEKHDDFSQKIRLAWIQREKALNEKYKNSLWEGRKKVWEIDGVKATFLDKFDDIVAEGQKMHHCVGSYASSCYDDQYAVFHISGDGEETTLGVTMRPKLIVVEDSQQEGWSNFEVEPAKFKYSIQQHYGMLNAAVKSDKHKAISQMIIKELNEEV